MTGPVDLPAADGVLAPTARMARREWRATIELARSAVRTRDLQEWPQGDGHPVRRRHRRIRGVGEEVSAPAGGQDDVGRAQPADGPRPQIEHAAPGAARALDGEVEQEVVLQQVGRGAGGGAGEGVLDLRPGGVAPGVEHAAPRVGALHRQRDGAVHGVEVDSGPDQVANPVRPLGAEDAYRLRIAQPGAGKCSLIPTASNIRFDDEASAVARPS